MTSKRRFSNEISMALNRKYRLKIAQWNAQGLKRRDKITEFREIVRHHSFDVVMLNETWYINDKKPPTMRGMKRSLKIGRQTVKGGLAVYYKNSLDVTTA